MTRSKPVRVIGVAVAMIGVMLAVPAAAPVAGPTTAGTMAAATKVPARGGVTVTLDGDSLNWSTLTRILRADDVNIRLGGDARAEMARTRKGGLAAIESGERVYGWNQALGPLKDEPLTVKEQREFQRRVLRSHAAGVGPTLKDRVSRLALVLRANSMARARMGVRPELVDRMLAMVNAGVVPMLPEIGSLGTGDLQPMAAAGLSLIGESNPVRYDGTEMSPDKGLKAAGLPTSFRMEAGEALAMVSGSSVLTARLVEALDRADRSADTFEAGFALFLEATRAEQGAFDARTHAERRIPAENEAARRIRALTCDSDWMTEKGRTKGGETSPRIQDAVSVRATPHILGALRQTIGELRRTVVREAGASTSNPLLFPKKKGDGYEFVMGGNWDAAQLGHQIDALNAQIADLGVLAHELSGRLLDPKWSYGLPANLAGGKVGLNSGMVQVQTVASALVPELQVAATPAGTLSRPVKGGQEDHNTMAMASMRNLAGNLGRLDMVLAVQAMTGAQGIDLMRPKMGSLRIGAGSSAVRSAVRAKIEQLGDDRYQTPDVRRAVRLVRSGELSRVVDRETADAPACADR